MAGYMKWHTDYTHVDGPSIVGGFAFNMDRHFAFREAPSLPYLDLDYRDVTGNSAKIIPEVYRKIGAPLTETALGAMQQWERANPTPKNGGHRYAPEEFGMSEAFIDEQCRRTDDFYRSTLCSPYRSFQQVNKLV